MSLFNMLGSAILFEIPYGVRQIIEYVLLILMCLLSIAMIIIVLKQDGETDDLGAISGKSETYYSQNKAKSREGSFKKVTIIVAICLVAISLIYFLLKTNLFTA